MYALFNHKAILSFTASMFYWIKDFKKNFLLRFVVSFLNSCYFIYVKEFSGVVNSCTKKKVMST